MLIFMFLDGVKLFTETLFAQQDECILQNRHFSEKLQKKLTFKGVLSYSVPIIRVITTYYNTVGTVWLIRG